MLGSLAVVESRECFVAHDATRFEIDEGLKDRVKLSLFHDLEYVATKRLALRKYFGLGSEERARVGTQLFEHRKSRTHPLRTVRGLGREGENADQLTLPTDGHIADRRHAAFSHPRRQLVGDTPVGRRQIEPPGSRECPFDQSLRMGKLERRAT